jgi:FAD/FMN-containing dehydrogenase
MNLKQEIQKFFKGDVEDSDEVLTQYSHDASLLEVRPQVVVFPKNSEDIKNLVKWVQENKEEYPDLAITPRSAGTCMSGGAIGESIVMDFTRYMNALERVGKVTPFSMTPKYPNAKDVIISGVATVEPGCYYRDFEPKTLEQGLLLPCYTASKTLNAMGGMVGNNSAGEKTLSYGKTEDYIKELNVIFADGREYTVRALTKKELYAKIAQGDFEGNIYKNIFQLINENKEAIKNAKPQVSKNSAGYYVWNVVNSEYLDGSGELDVFDLTKLIVGSQGTLGIVTKITLYLVAVKPASKLVVIFMKDITRLGELVDTILPHNPESLESYDDATMKLAIRFFPDFLKNKGLWGMIKFMWSFLPEVFMMTTFGMPKLILLVEFAGANEKEIDQNAKQLLPDLKKFDYKIRVTSSQAESEKYWTIRRDSFALLRTHVANKHTAPFIDDIIVRPEILPEFLPKLDVILKKYPIEYTIAGHAGNGNFHIIPLMDFSKSETATIILDLSKEVYDLVLSYNGSTTAEHNDGLIRSPFLMQMFGEKVYKLFEQTKYIFDSANMFNPGKKIGATKEYIQEHIITESHDLSQRM